MANDQKRNGTPVPKTVLPPDFTERLERVKRDNGLEDASNADLVRFALKQNANDGNGG